MPRPPQRAPPVRPVRPAARTGNRGAQRRPAAELAPSRMQTPGSLAPDAAGRAARPQVPITPFFGEGYWAVLTSPNRTLYKLPSLDSQLTPCRRQELLSQLELCLFSCQGFLLTQEKERKKNDEVGQSGVLPFSAASGSLPVFFWNESSRALKVRIKALFPIREIPDQAQLGVESVLCAGGVHGFRPPLCRQASL